MKNEGTNKIVYQMGLSRAPRYLKKKREKNERKKKKLKKKLATIKDCGYLCKSVFSFVRLKMNY